MNVCAYVHVQCSLYRFGYLYVGVCCSEDLGYRVSAVCSCVHCICVPVYMCACMCACVCACVHVYMCPCVGV